MEKKLGKAKKEESYTPDQKLWDTLPFMQNLWSIRPSLAPSSMQCWVTVPHGGEEVFSFAEGALSIFEKP